MLATDDVAGGPDALLARSELGADRDESARVRRDAGPPQVETVGVRPASGGDEEPLGANDPAGLRRLGLDPDLSCVALDPLDPGAGDDLDPFGLEDLAEGPWAASPSAELG